MKIINGKLIFSASQSVITLLCESMFNVKVCSLLFQMDCMGENLFLHKLESNLYKKDI